MATPAQTASTTSPMTACGLDEADTERLREGLAANPELLDRFCREYFEIGRDLQRLSDVEGR